ncbi:hypothetical protein NL676_007169 [Syzygium grande]|nr:hypothetical protein NL676_007169 [Syzygium grande]
MSRVLSWWSLITLLLLVLLASDLAISLNPDGLSLLSLKSAVDQGSAASSAAFADWNEDDPTPCRWTGVSCANASADPANASRVVGLALSGKSLRGYIPSELGTLLYLRRLNLHNNDLSGPIPDPLFNATSLHSIFLYGNNLSGPLPPSICDLPRLQNLDLSNNSLSGALPDGLRSCKQLQRLILADNRFSGEIPAAIWPALQNLVQLDLSSNEFAGPIPSEIGELKSLSGTLNLSHNHLSGDIPKALGSSSPPREESEGEKRGLQRENRAKGGGLGLGISLRNGDLKERGGSLLWRSKLGELDAKPRRFHPKFSRDLPQDAARRFVSFIAWLLVPVLEGEEKGAKLPFNPHP